MSGKSFHGRAMRSYSIVIPTLNEEKAMGALTASLRQAPGEVEIIVADGGSADETVRLAKANDWRVVAAPRGRGPQMNAGAQVSTGEVIVFLHADTHLPEGAFEMIEAALADPRVAGGNFELLFDGKSREARWLTRLYPFLRLGGMCYGDSAFFIRRTVFEEVGGYRAYPIFEDCDLYRRVKRLGKFQRLAAAATTSSRRFEGRFFRTFALWASLQVLYWLGVSPRRLGRLYRPLR